MSNSEDPAGNWAAYTNARIAAKERRREVRQWFRENAFVIGMGVLVVAGLAHDVVHGPTPVGCSVHVDSHRVEDGA